jgi:hypothetical protein
MRIETTEAVIGHRAEFQADGDLAVHQSEVGAPERERLYHVFEADRGAEALQDLAKHFDTFEFRSYSMRLV